MVRPHARNPSGFTIMELMISLVIIGLMAMAIAPSLSEVLADNRQGAAAQDLVRVSRRARALALGSGVAHMLRFQSASANALGAIELYAGMNNKCLQTPWASAFAAATNIATSPHAIETFSMGYYNPTNGTAAPTASDVGRHVITLRATLDTASTDIPLIWLCYQPNGDSYTMTTSPANLATFGKQTQSVLFTIARSVRTSSVVPHGRDRQVIFPVGGTARSR